MGVLSKQCSGEILILIERAFWKTPAKLIKNGWLKNKRDLGESEEVLEGPLKRVKALILILKKSSPRSLLKCCHDLEKITTDL